MTRILVPCDGSDHSMRAVQYAAFEAAHRPTASIDLLYVDDPVPNALHAARTARQLDDDLAAHARHVLRPAMSALDAAGVNYTMHWRTGSAPVEIARHAQDAGCQSIIMGTRGMGPLAGAVIGSVATRTVHLVQVPVTLIK